NRGTGWSTTQAGCPSGQWEWTVNPSAYAYAGSNPAPATLVRPPFEGACRVSRADREQTASRHRIACFGADPCDSASARGGDSRGTTARHDAERRRVRCGTATLATD